MESSGGGIKRKPGRIYEATGNETGRSFLCFRIREIREHLARLAEKGL